MLTILREAEEWTRIHLHEDCLLFASAITKSSLYLRQNDKAHAHQITLLSLAPLMGTIFYLVLVLVTKSKYSILTCIFSFSFGSPKQHWLRPENRAGAEVVMLRLRRYIVKLYI